MRVVIITKGGFPNGMASAKRIMCYAKALLSAGVDCEVVAYFRTERHGDKPKNTEGSGVFGGVPFRYVGNTPLRGSNVFIRKWNDFLDRLRLRQYLRRVLHKGDVVFGYVGTDVFFVNSIIRLVHNCGAKFVRELCELPYGTGAETVSAIRYRHVSLKTQFPLCDGIICISDTLHNLAQQYVSEKCRLLKIPIMVEYDAYEMKDKSRDAEFPYVFHSGTLFEQKDGILGMIEAFGLAVQKTDVPLHFFLTGNMELSPHAREIKRIIDKYRIGDRLRFTGYLSEEELKWYLSRASLVIINKYETQQNHYCFSTKLAEYLAAGKPVVITDVGEAMNWLRNGETAYIVPAGDTERLSTAIVEAMERTDERRRISRNGKALCGRVFDCKCYGDKLRLFFEDVSKI